MITEADIEQTILDMVEQYSTHQPRKTGKTRVVISLGSDLQVSGDLIEAISRLEAQHNIVVEEVRTKEGKTVLGDETHPVTSTNDIKLFAKRFWPVSIGKMIDELTVAAPPITSSPFKEPGNEPWRGNGKRRARIGHKGNHNGKSR